MDPVEDDDSEQGDQRTEGMNAHVFSSSIGANGYIPQHKEPPRYIRIRAHNKKEKEFNRMFLAQELGGHVHKANEDTSKVLGLTATEVALHSKTPHKIDRGGAVWATEFSRDGKYLAAAGQDQIVRVWAVLSTHEERHAHEKDEDATVGKNERLSAPVFASKPVREFQGHTSTVLDLSWSKNNFLLSSSMDKTVRLWHISRQECLCTFKHKDFVTSIAFHPKDDRFFLAGSLDSVLRLWSIPDKSVAFWNQLPDLITAVAFSPDGKTAIAGVLSGLCLFYETEGLKYHTQIHVRSSRGKNAKGSKITGIRCCIYPPNDLNGETKVLITTNDSRVRMYNLRDKNLEMKFRGHENTCSQIKASISDDTSYIICGSEDRKAYIWSTGLMDTDGKDKRPVEIFEAHPEMVTTTIMAPVKTRQLLSQSGDPIYDLCNPPPVTLLSRAESNVSSRPPTIVVAEKRNSDPISEPGSASKKPEESPAYLIRSRHEDGNIIITADHSGTIKVFRQDCAYQKRRNDTWETGSTFSKKIGTLGRSGSVTSHARRSGTHSRRNSVQVSSPSAANLGSDRILSWRNSIASNTSLGDNSSMRASRNSVRTDRSVSPGKFSQVANSAQGTPTMASTARQQPYVGNSAPLSSPTQSVYKSNPSGSRKTEATKPSLQDDDSGGKLLTSPKDEKINVDSPEKKQPPTPSFKFYSSEESNSLRLDGTGKSYQFWNVRAWANPLASASAPKESDKNKLGVEGLRPSVHRGRTDSSVVSKLSDEVSDMEGGSSQASGGSESRSVSRDNSVDRSVSVDMENDPMKCHRCGGTDFRVQKGGNRGGKRLVCGRCGWIAD